MKKQRVKYSMVSWPRVVRKWLNIQSGSHKYYSDYSLRGEEAVTERRKSCSDGDYYMYMPQNLLGMSTHEQRAQLQAARSDYEPNVHTSTDTLDLRMFVGTWNVGGKAPDHELNLKDWLSTSCPADIYVLGFQEIVPLNAGNILGAEDNSPAAKWLNLIRQALNGCSAGGQEEPRAIIEDCISPSSISGHRTPKKQRYILAASKQMVGIFLCVWVRADLSKYIGDLKVSCVGTGIMGYLGNKGSISISMSFGKTTLCFVCTHLASGEKEGDEVRRNLDVKEILRKTRFCDANRKSRLSSRPRTILQHDKIIWLGDLNYRLASVNHETLELIQKHDWRSLLEKDQLKLEQIAHRVFTGWEEGQITFAPTYKYIVNSDHYVVSMAKEKRRTPAWCDRILWKGEGLQQLCYERGESKFSDHRPVHSLFDVSVDFTSKQVTDEHSLQMPIKLSLVATTALASTNGAKVQAEELLLVPKTQSCITTQPRFPNPRTLRRDCDVKQTQIVPSCYAYAETYL